MESVIKTAFPFVVYGIGVLMAFQIVLMIVAYTVLAERKVLGWMQGRIGPNRVGPWGVLQPFADLLKFIFKEDLTPDKSTKFVYFLAPLVALTCALMPMVVYPFGPAITTVDWSFLPYGLGEGVTALPLTIARIDVGVLFILGITSVGVYGIALAGWSSNNKYSLMGGLRSSAQMISYELAMGASVIGAVMLAGTLDLNGIIFAQIHSPFRWFIIPQFIGFVVFLISAFAETNRVPFDLPEAAPDTGPQRISFAKGANWGTVNVTLAPGTAKKFVVAAKSGQTMDVELSSKEASVNLIKGKADTTEDFGYLNAELKSNGDYIFEVRNSTKKDVRSSVKVTIESPSDEPDEQ